MSLAVTCDGRVEQRVEFLNHVALTLFDSEVFPESEVIFRQARTKIVAEGYFILNNAYKRWRIKDGHYTQPPKIAALQCMAIATFQPMLPLAPENAKTRIQARANEIYALACGCGVLKISFDLTDSIGKDFWLRLLDVLAESPSDTLETYRVDLNFERSRPWQDYELELTASDKSRINNLVTIFELLDNRITIKRY